MTLSGINITKHVKKNLYIYNFLYAPNIPRIALDSSSETFIFILAPIRNLFLLIISYIRPSTSVEPSFLPGNMFIKGIPGAEVPEPKRKLVFFSAIQSGKRSIISFSDTGMMFLL